MLWLHFVSQNVDGFLWTPAMLWRVTPWGEVRFCQTHQGLVNVIRLWPATQACLWICVLWSLWNRGGQCRILGNQILRVLLGYVIKYVWSQRQRLSTVESLRVISVHLSLTLPGGGDMGSCIVPSEIGQHTLSLPPQLWSKTGWTGSWEGAKTFVKGEEEPTLGV